VTKLLGRRETLETAGTPMPRRSELRVVAVQGNGMARLALTRRSLQTLIYCPQVANMVDDTLSGLSFRRSYIRVCGKGYIEGEFGRKLL
jgi:hypothetical protein